MTDANIGSRVGLYYHLEAYFDGSRRSAFIIFLIDRTHLVAVRFPMFDTVIAEGRYGEQPADSLVRSAVDGSMNEVAFQVCFRTALPRYSIEFGAGKAARLAGTAGANLSSGVIGTDREGRLSADALAATTVYS